MEPPRPQPLEQRPELIAVPTTPKMRAEAARVKRILLALALLAILAVVLWWLFA